MNEQLRRQPLNVMMDRERAKKEFEPTPHERIVITGIAQTTSLGGTWETWDGINSGKSGAREFDVENYHTSIAAPALFNPLDYFDAKRMDRDITPIKAMAIVTAREAARNAGVIGPDGKIVQDLDRKKFGSWIGSGIGSTQMLIDVYRAIYEEKNGVVDRRKNTRRGIPLTTGLRIFPEEINGDVARELGLSGWGGSSVEACATGLSNIVEAVRTIRDGYNDIAVAGGFEDPLSDYAEVGIGLFAPLPVLSKRNDDPKRASRPFDKDRDGFVLGSGGATVVVEGLDHALKRGAPILAEVIGFRKAMDGFDPMELDEERVAHMILSTMWDEKINNFNIPEAIFAHATSTRAGDIKEARLLRRALTGMLNHIPITANKSNLGHLAGGAGSVNTVLGIQSLLAGRVPHIINLDNPENDLEEIKDPDGNVIDSFRISDLTLVRNQPLVTNHSTALVLGYGFGGHDAALLLRKWNTPQLQAAAQQIAG